MIDLHARFTPVLEKLGTYSLRPEMDKADKAYNNLLRKVWNSGLLSCFNEKWEGEDGDLLVELTFTSDRLTDAKSALETILSKVPVLAKAPPANHPLFSLLNELSNLDSLVSRFL